MSEPPANQPASAAPGDDEPVPKLPRGRGLKLSGPELFRIAITLITLVGVIALTQPCASSVSRFVTGFDEGSGKEQPPKPTNVAPPRQDLQNYEQLKPGMSEAELKAAVERAKARNSESPSGGGSGPSGAGSGSAAGSSGDAESAVKPDSRAAPSAGSTEESKSR